MINWRLCILIRATNSYARNAEGRAGRLLSSSGLALFKRSSSSSDSFSTATGACALAESRGDHFVESAARCTSRVRDHSTEDGKLHVRSERSRGKRDIGRNIPGMRATGCARLSRGVGAEGDGVTEGTGERGGGYGGGWGVP